MIREVLADGSIDRGGAFQSIPRPRVQARLAEACAERVALIVAPAGYGKSVALNAYLESIRTPYVRYDVDETAATLAGFVRGLVLSLAEIAPGALASLPDALKSVSDSPAVGSELALWLNPHLKAYGGTIVIDDFHKAGSDPETSRFIASLIDKTKSRTRWLLATRSTLDLPVASWLAYGMSGMALDEQDLSFDLDEAKKSARSLRLAVREDELVSLLSLTSGWPTAVIFALRSSTRSNELRNIAATTREMIYRYLAEQVYQSMDESTREFLRDAAILPRLDVVVLQQMGYDRAESLLEELRNSVAFISVSSPGHYRIHDLFRDFLDYESRMLGKSNLDERLRRVAQALEKTGRHEECLLLYRRADDWASVERVIDAVGFELMMSGGNETMESIVSAMPNEMRTKNPVVVGLRAGFQADKRRFSEAERLYRKALSFSIDDRLRARFALALNALLVGNGQTTGIALLEDPRLVEHPDIGVRVDIAGSLAMVYSLDQQPDRAKAMIEACLESIDDVDDDTRVRTFSRISVASYHLSDYEHVEQYATEGASLASEIGRFGAASRCFSSLYAVSSMRGDNTQALWYAQQMAASATKSADRYMLNRAMTSILDIESQRGNFERVDSTLRSMTELFGRESLNNHDVLEVLAIQAAWAASFERAAAYLIGSLKGQVGDTHLAFRRSLLAVFYAALGQRDSALSLLSLAQPTESGFGALDRVGEFAVAFSAIANVLLGRTTVAKKALRANPPLADTGAIIWRISLALCDDVPSASRVELESGVRALTEAGFGGYAAVIRSLPCFTASSVLGLEVLTPTESAVFSLLDRGLRPKAIAESTGRSVHTVQNHIRAVISKLGTSGREEALIVARQRGLIPEKPTSQI